ncbi:hypothetical protein RFM26_21795 [Mesorhizobium sp. VK23B]|uniref:Blue (type 1) copper domain-containing protein n=1 Tax=Mesorhizobium dulcispinae TaxID=3072316 RepID=A0ABU4XIT8_9HYPH|nr:MULTISPECIES: hypothetical protein [unclassified Mesorhizobium]MDX8468337.1 hypothetical protein [Mesorhizobium sp. VK23B]MDX8474675.1 hypothetical protein [Mesorhizobium sp. VK23A]MDX8519702.1 hypothetical protein [Mesorhizobium sp. VK23D]
MALLGGAAFAAAMALGLWSTAASAATVVDVQLWDQGAGMVMKTGMAYQAPGLDLSKATMGVKASRSSAPAGAVSFKVTNTSKGTVHEMIVMHLKDPTQPLPYVGSDAKVDESKAEDRGEVPDLAPGKSGTLTVTLEPGKYLLICNQPKHFASGMWALFEVTK